MSHRMFAVTVKGLPAMQLRIAQPQGIRAAGGCVRKRLFVFRKAVLLRGTTAEISWASAMGLDNAMLLAMAMGWFHLQRLALLLVVISVSVASDLWYIDTLAIATLAAVVLWQRLAQVCTGVGDCAPSRR